MSTTTKTPYAVEALEDRLLLSGFEAHVNFQPTKAPVPDGYIRDSGNIYGTRQGQRYGWNVKTAKAVDRNAPISPDQRYDTFINLLQGTQKLRWEIAVPSGTYMVRIVGGDPASKGDIIKIAAEDRRVVNGTTSGAQRWIEGSKLITVTDGRLTIQSSTNKAIGNKINFIDIVQVTDARGTFQAEDNSASTGVVDTGTTIDQAEEGDWIRFDDLLFSDSLKSVAVRLGVDLEDGWNTIEFRLDSPTGQLLGSLDAQPTGGESDFMTQFAPISGASGIHDLYLVFKGDSEVGNIDSITLSDQRILKVMPLGDSITEARGGYDSYRHDLWHHLVDEGGRYIDFVGSMHGVRPNSGDPAHWHYDLDHEGHSGFRADQIRDNLNAWLAASDVPDVVLLHIGTNDLRQGQGVQDAIDEIGDIIDILRQRNPAVAVVLAQIIPTSEEFIDGDTLDEFNSAVAALAASMSTSASPIQPVDFPGFDPALHTFDGIHPTAEGESFMARQWAEAVVDLLD